MNDDYLKVEVLRRPKYVTSGSLSVYVSDPKCS